MDAKLIRRITDAVEDGEWRQALAIAHGLAPSNVEALVGDALLSMRLTRVAFHAGVGLNTELIRVFGKSIGAANLTPATFPELFSARVSALCIERFKRAVSDDDWGQASEMLRVTTRLPSLNRTQYDETSALVGYFVARVQTLHNDALESGYKPSNTPNQLMCFEYIPIVFRVLTCSEYYPKLSEKYLASIFRFADYPILRRLDAHFILIAWPELVALFQDRSALKGFSEAAADWLCRAIVLDPEPYSADECEEEDQP